MKPRRSTTRRLRPVTTACPYCEGKTEPDYKDISMLTKFISERGKIVGRARTGVCAKHQRKLTTAIKRSRYIGLMPFVVRA